MANKPLRIPVDLLNNAVESGIFCLPLAGRDVLLSIADRLLWDIYVDASGNKVILDDKQMAVIEETIEGLLMGCEFPDYSNELAALAEAIASIQISSTCAPNITVSCGDSSFITIPGPGMPPVINPGPLPDVPVDPDNPVPLPDDYPSVPLDPEVDAPPFDYPDWGAYDVAACEAANAAVDFGYQLLRAIRDFVTQDLILLAWLVVAINAVLTGGIALLFSSAFVIKLAEIAYKLITRWEITVTIEFLDDMIAFIDANRQDMVCDLYESRTGGMSGVNSMLARVLNFAAGLEYAQAEFSTIQELVTMILPPGLFFAALAGAVDYENANFVDCGLCDEPYEGPPTGLHWVRADMLEIVQYGTNGQSYESIGSNGIRIFGSNHPGNVKFGYNVRFAPPTGTIALAMGLSRVTIVSPRLREATGLTSFVTGEILHTSYPALVCGTISTITPTESTFISSYFVKYLSKLTIAIDREWAYLGVAASSGLDGLDYDVSISDMYFLVRD
ncbi:MAG: hypothetical protein IPN33_25360 [Saprospiraceae bacterium]|nr:hypothetical protein [Saprospiraceae bacterium]